MNTLSFRAPTAAAVALIAAGCGQSTDADTGVTAQAASAAATVAAVAAGGMPDLGDTPAGTYGVEKTHAYITFFYDHQGYSKPYLRFRSFDGAIDLDPADLSKSTVNIVIDVNSIDTGVDIFDEHLRSDDWFGVATHPEATFASTSFEPSATGGTLTGDLTIKGITKPVTLDVTFNKAGQNFRSKVPQVGFSAKTVVQRSDWDLGKYAPAVGDDVTLLIEAEFQKQD